jgi:hypothetical protein
MAKENKTKETKNSVSAFIGKVKNTQQKTDASAIVKLFSEETGEEAKMWGSAIIGFGTYHYKYPSGREGDAPLVGFSPRKDAFALYIAAFEGRDKLLEKFGKYKASTGCIYIKKLEDVDTKVLKKLVSGGVKHYKKLYK